MITSTTRHADYKLYTIALELLESAIRQYKRTGDKDFIPEIDRLNNFSEELKQKIQSKDYTEDDEREIRVNKILKAYDTNK